MPDCPVCWEPVHGAGLLCPPACAHALCAACAEATWLCVPPVCTLCGEPAPEPGWREVAFPPAAPEADDGAATAALRLVQERMEQVREAANACRAAAAGQPELLRLVGAEERRRLKALSAQTDELQVRARLTALFGCGGAALPAFVPFSGPAAEACMEVVELTDGTLRLRLKAVAACEVAVVGLRSLEAGEAGEADIGPTDDDPRPWATVEIRLLDDLGRPVTAELPPVVTLWGEVLTGGLLVADGAAVKYWVSPLPLPPLKAADGRSVPSLTVSSAAGHVYAAREVAAGPGFRCEPVPVDGFHGAMSSDGKAFASDCLHNHGGEFTLTMETPARGVVWRRMCQRDRGLTRSERFKFEAGGPPYRLLVVHTARNRVCVYGEDLHEVKHAVRVPNPTSAAAHLGGTLAVGTADAHVYCFGAGRVLWQAQVEGEVSDVEFSVGGRRVGAVTGRCVYVLAGSVGTVLHSFPFRPSTSYNNAVCRLTTGQVLVSDFVSKRLVVLRPDLSGVERAHTIEILPRILSALPRGKLHVGGPLSLSLK